MKTVTREQLEKLPHKFQVAFALFCAKQVSHLNTDERVHNCIEVVEKWLEGKATDADARAAAGAADAVADAAARTDAYAAYTAARAAGAAARTAAYTADAAYTARTAARAADAYAGAAADAAYVTAGAAARASTRATYAADAKKLIEEQNRYYEELLNFDNIVEAELFKTTTDL